jgi:hypothetical protein
MEESYFWATRTTVFLFSAIFSPSASKILIALISFDKALPYELLPSS